MRYPENVEALAVRLEANGKPELARRARELARKYREWATVHDTEVRCVEARARRNHGREMFRRFWCDLRNIVRGPHRLWAVGDSLAALRAARRATRDAKSLGRGGGTRRGR